MQYTGLLKFLLHECKLKCISERKVLHSYLCKMSLNGGKLRSKILVKRGHYTWSIYWPGGGSRSCFWRYRLLVFCKHPHLWFTWFFILWPFLSDPPLIGLTPPPFCFQGFTLAILKIETWSENKKFSICPKLTFSFLDHVSIFNIATVNPLPPKYRANHAQSVLGGSRSQFWR